MLSHCCLKVLSQCCPNVVSMLSQCCLNVVSMLSQCCLNVVSVLSLDGAFRQLLFRDMKFPMLSQCCLNVVSMLSQCCLNVVSGSFENWRRTDVVSILSQSKCFLWRQHRSNMFIFQFVPKLAKTSPKAIVVQSCGHQRGQAKKHNTK